MEAAYPDTIYYKQKHQGTGVEGVRKAESLQARCVMRTCRLPLLCFDIVKESIIRQIAEDEILIHVLEKFD